MSEQKQKPILMIPGPIEFHEDVLRAMGEQSPSHVAPSFIEEFGATLEGLRKVFLAPNGQPVVVAGSGTLGWDIITANLAERGAEALVVNTGYFSDSFADCCEAYGVNVTTVGPADPIGSVCDLKEVEAALASKKFDMICLTQVDTSTGVLNDIKALSALARASNPDIIVTVDGVCSFGGEEFRFEDWGVDAAMTASQKALGVPPGLMVMMLSQRAVDFVGSRATPIPSYFASLRNWLPIMKLYEERKGCYFATPAVNLIRALHVSVNQLNALGMEEVFARHNKISKAFKAALKHMGFTLLPQEEVAANTLSAIRYPEGVTGSELLTAIKSKGVIIAGGLHKQCKAEYFRIGHMGISVLENEARGHMERVVEAVEYAGITCGMSIEPNSSVAVFKNAL
jgi:alanine-glyoxylate transaminase/serine-glyoxylate transaminase/serine-pyruvate transaminase